MLKSVKDFVNSKITRTFAKFSADNEISSKAKRKLKDLQQTRVVQEQIKTHVNFYLISQAQPVRKSSELQEFCFGTTIKSCRKFSKEKIKKTR